MGDRGCLVLGAGCRVPYRVPSAVPAFECHPGAACQALGTRHPSTWHQAPCTKHPNMRYLVLTDIHSNLEALDTCVTDARARGFDDTLVLGDLVGYGADPNAVVECVQAL